MSCSSPLDNCLIYEERRAEQSGGEERRGDETRRDDKERNISTCDALFFSQSKPEPTANTGLRISRTPFVNAENLQKNKGGRGGQTERHLHISLTIDISLSSNNSSIKT